MIEREPATAGQLAAYQAEVERWNRQMNLVSRKGDAGSLKALVDQTLAAFEVAWSAASAAGAPAATAYIDLGSGAGLPAFPWHVMLGLRSPEAASLLVEPREKRAWFLERLPAVTGARDWTVACGRWGEVEADLDLPAPGLVLVSLKALHLTDEQVLQGLSRVLCRGRRVDCAGTRIRILRFVPPHSRWDELSRKVAATAEGDFLVVGSARFRSTGGRVLASDELEGLGAALSLSSYDSTV